MRISQIQFVANLVAGAEALATAFPSLPLKGQEEAWLSQAAARRYCETYPSERADVNRYFVPSIPPETEEGVVTILSAVADRPVHFCAETKLWTVNFGPEGSIVQAGKVLAALPPGTEVTNIGVLK